MTTRIKSKVIAKYHHNGFGIVTAPLEHNPVSVACTIYILESGESATRFRLNRWHQGHVGLAHGGITASILDEVMGYSNHAREYVLSLGYTPVFTGTAKYVYRKPVPTETEMYAVARVNEVDDRRRFITGEIIDSEGDVYVSGESIFITDKGGVIDSKEIVEMAELTDDDPKEI